MPPPTDEPPSLLTQTFQDIPLPAHPQAWSSLYQANYHPWDREGPSLALADLLTHRPDLVPAAQDRDHHGNPLRDASGRVTRRTALVPGCGPGHDVLLLRSFGYDVVGLDCSPEAIRMAEENARRADEGGKKQGGYDYAPVGGLEPGTVRWVVGDFFAEWNEGLGRGGAGRFDLIFDYTFLCALPPSARPKWSARMAQLLHPAGHLICLEFPSGKPLSEGGPPWGLTPEVYEALLTSPGRPITYREEEEGGVVVEDGGLPARPHLGALHRLSIMKPVRTHKAGTNEDGTVRDFISVWTA